MNSVTALAKPNKKCKTPQELAEALQIKLTDYDDLTFTEDELDYIRRRLTNLRTGSTAAIPLLCAGDKCPFRENCPFFKVGKAPVFKSCLVEINLINEWRRMFIEEYNIDENSFSEILMVSELVEIELMLWRINNNLSKAEYAELVNNVNVGVDAQGNPVQKLETNAFFETREKLVARKSRIIKLMVGDRQEKYKEQAALKKVNDSDPSRQAADVRKKLDSLAAQAKQIAADLQKENAIDVKPEILAPEDLIEAE